MIFVESEHGPGVVGFVGGENARYHSFTMCYTALNCPPESRGYSGLGYDVAYNRNAIIKHALDWPEAQWVQIWDDDHVFSPDTLLRLLDKKVDVIVPFYRQRQPPCRPCIYKQEMDNGAYAIFTDLDLEGMDGHIPVISAGAGGVLIRRRVLEAFPDPWFERRGLIGEDHMFFKKCREAGFQPWCALDVGIGHSTTVEVWPMKNEKGQHGTSIDLKGEAPNKVELWHEKYRG